MSYGVSFLLSLNVLSDPVEAKDVRKDTITCTNVWHEMNKKKYLEVQLKLLICES